MTLFEPVPSPPSQQKANARAAPALIEDTLPLPALLFLRSRSYLDGLYSRQHLSAREIERLLGVSMLGC
jgi:hypothetical protein